MEKTSFLFVFFLCLFSVTLSGQQVCEDNWTGSDCTIFSQLTRPDQLYHGNVDSGKWRYYYVNILESGILTATLKQAGEGFCDLDFYVRQATFPTFEDYLYRDFSMNVQSQLSFAAEGSYFFGVHGYMGCDYTFQYTVGSACQCDSILNGECLGGSDECSCFEGFTGERCALRYQLTPSGQQNFRVNVEGWEYFSMKVTDRPNKLRFELHLDGEGEDTNEADMYLAAGRIPTLRDYDYRTPPGGEDTVMRIILSQPRGNTEYFIGIHARETSSYWMIATIIADDNCPNQCSNHGQCQSGSCSCNTDFSGPSCEHQDSALTFEDPTSGFAGEGAWNYYFINLDTVTNAVISLQQTNEDADCDVYVNKGNPPNFFNYLYYDNSNLTNSYLTIPSPDRGTWHIGVYGFKDCQYTMSISEAANCACTPNSHGSCIGGNSVCVCQSGWGGDDCNVPIKALENGVLVRDQAVSIHSWTYFSIDVPKSIGLTVAIREKNTVGSLWLFASAKDSPSLTSYDAVERAADSPLHQIDITADFSDHTIVFGVFANPYATSNLMVFDIVAWYAPF